MEAAKSLLAEKGISGTNMIEIADRAQVSRASLYNHFRDKYLISREISAHPGLKTALQTDGDIMAAALTAREHKIWVDIYSQLAKIFATDVVGVGLILRWLMGQVTAPLSDDHSKQQAERLASIL